MSTLVTFFSAEGTTAKVAKEFAERIGADIFEIWKNPVSRCNREQMGGKDVPVADKIDDLKQYDTVYIGFPIWYGQAPRVVYTFCKDYDWSGITIHAFATSGGSGIGKTADKLQKYVSGAASVDAKLVRSASEL